MVVLSHKFWQRHFNGDPSVVGKPIQMVHKTYTILGVLPPRFTWLDGDVYLPLNLVYFADDHLWHVYQAQAGRNARSRRSRIRAALPAVRQRDPKSLPKQYKLEVRNISYYYMHELGGTLALLFGAVGLLLAIGCGNVSILLLARGTARQHEFAVRSAVGASGFRHRPPASDRIAAIWPSPGAGLGVFLAYQSLGLDRGSFAGILVSPRGGFPCQCAGSAIQRRPCCAHWRILWPVPGIAAGPAGDQPGNAAKHPQSSRNGPREAIPHCS